MTGSTRRWQQAYKLMQDYSIGEVESLVLKAYRGAGFSWGLAQEAGNAAAWMAMNSLPALDEFAHLLEHIDRQVTGTLSPLINDKTCWVNPSKQLCPVITGAAFSESDLDAFDLKQGLTIQAVCQPMILVPFIAKSAKVLQRNIVLQFSEIKIICGKTGGGHHCLTQLASTGAFIGDVSLLQTDRASPDSVDIHQRAVAAPQSLKILNKLAHRTYVPASEESRLAGAGAGLLDND